MVRWIAIVMLIVVAAIGFVAWEQYSAPPAAAGAMAGGAPSGMPAGDAGAMPPATGGDAAAAPSGNPHAGMSDAAPDPGIAWDVPAGWQTGPPKMMRFATYLPKDAECAVFYFGPGQGGAVDDNIDRWATQFEGTPNPKREISTIAGMRVTRVHIEGTYLSPGADMQSQGKQPNSRMLGAIIDGPQGMVFFKLTGPAAAVGAASKGFDAMLASLHKK